MLDGDAPEVCVVREALEETGITIARAAPRLRRLHEPRRHDRKDRLLRRALSAGEPLRATAAASTRTSTSRSIEVPFAEALAMIESGEIADAKTIALLYYAEGEGAAGIEARGSRKREHRGIAVLARV